MKMCIKKKRLILDGGDFVSYDKSSYDVLQPSGVYNWGGRKHYIFWCPICNKEHEYIGPETGVLPEQPALGWIED